MTDKRFQVYLDMDGCIVDLLQGCLDFFQSDKTLENDWPNGKWGDDKIFKMMFGRGINTVFETISFSAFWENLSLMHDGAELLRVLNPYKPVILSVPISGGAAGKQNWIKKRLPEYWKEKRYILTGSKKYVAGINRILIDDSDDYIKEWTDAGGIGILVPRKWNSMYYQRDDAVGHVVKSLEYLTGLTRLRSE